MWPGTSDCRHIVKSAVMFMPETVRKLREGGEFEENIFQS